MAAKPNVHSVRIRRDRVASWEQYPFTIDTIRAFDTLKIRARVLFFVGENGSGKSTVIEALARSMGFGSEGGTRNMTFSTRASPAGERADEALRALGDALDVSRTKRFRTGFFLRAESFHNVATVVDDVGSIDAYGCVSLHERSHGEAFMALALNRFKPGGFYILDEPEAALSATRQMALMARINDLLVADADTQFVIATHSPILLAFPNAQIVSFDGGALHEIAYHDTDPYIITRRFMEHPDAMLQTLFEDSHDRE
jgi:predicted ATPase